MSAELFGHGAVDALVVGDVEIGIVLEDDPGEFFCGVDADCFDGADDGDFAIVFCGIEEFRLLPGVNFLHGSSGFGDGGDGFAEIGSGFSGGRGGVGR